MAEKPILKGDRDKKQQDPEQQRVDSTSGQEPRRSSDRPQGKPGKGKGRGKGRADREPKAPVNPALMRGPRPAKKVEPPPEETAPAEAAEIESTAETPAADADDAPAADAAPEEPA
jgi:hypothetical protein